MVVMRTILAIGGDAWTTDATASPRTNPNRRSKLRLRLKLRPGLDLNPRKDASDSTSQMQKTKAESL